MDKPFPAYQGDEPYVFVCYAHEDSDIVYPEMAWLHEQRINVWYDEGISGGKVWRAEIAKKIQGSTKCLYYVSAASLQSEHCNREIDYALDQACGVVPVFLEDTELPPELDLALHRVQALFRDSDTNYRRHLLDAVDGSTTVERSPVMPQKKRSWPLYAGSGLLVALGLLGWAGFEFLATATDGPIRSIAVQPLGNPSSDGAVSDHELPTIALLPLENHSGDPAQGYLGEAMSHEIWNRLAKLDALRLISMRSSKMFKNSPQDIREIASQLTADYIVDGAINSSGADARVSIHLIDATSGVSVWQETYSRKMEEVAQILSFYDDVASRIGQELEIVIREDDVTAAPVRAPDLAAFNLLQQARYGNRSWEKSLQLADAAIELDPEYGQAYATKAFFLAAQAEFGVIPALEGFEQARQLALRALDLDPNLANAYGTLGAVHDRIDLDFRKAVEAYSRAEELGAVPDDLPFKQDTLMNAGLYTQGLAFTQRWESTNPISGLARLFSARFLHRLGRLADARQKIDEALELSPDHPLVVFHAIRFYRDGVGDLDRAAAIIDASPKDLGLREVGHAYLALVRGDEQALRTLVEQWVANRDAHFVAATRISYAYFRLAEYQRHIEWFEIREQEREGLGWVMDFLKFQHPDYWDRLNEWAVSEPDKVRERLATIAAHRARIDRITEKMVL